MDALRVVAVHIEALETNQLEKQDKLGRGQGEVRNNLTGKDAHHTDHSL